MHALAGWNMQFDDKTHFLEGQTVNFLELKSYFRLSNFYASSGEIPEEGLICENVLKV